MLRFFRNLNPLALRRENARLFSENSNLHADVLLLNATLMYGAGERNMIRDALIETADELQMTDDLLEDAARLANRYENTLRELQTAIAAVGTPNGTTRKLGRLVDTALESTVARTLGEIPANDVFVLEAA